MSISSTLIEQLPINSSNYMQNAQSNIGNNIGNNNGNNIGNNIGNNGNNGNNIGNNGNNIGNNGNNGNNNEKIHSYGEQLNSERGSNNSHINPIDYTSQLTSVLKEATAAGATVLPSRDIPKIRFQFKMIDKYNQILFQNKKLTILETF